MTKTILLNKQEIGYCLKISMRAKRLRLAVYNDGRLVVTKPHFLSNERMEEFVRQKAAWILKYIAQFQNRPDISKAMASSREVYLEHRLRAYQLVQEKLRHFNQFYKLHFGRVSIRNQKSRWGSCSKKSNLNFNYKLAFLPEVVAEYVIVHELCHLAEFNHSPRFWQLVGQTIPNYQSLRRQLKSGRLL